MKIVSLSESFLEPEHLEELRQLGEVKSYTDTASTQQALERLSGADVAIGDCFLIDFSRKFFQQVSGLKLLVVNSTGYDRVDVAAASEQGVLVANVPHYSTEAVAEYTIALVLSLTRWVPLGMQSMRAKITDVIDPTDPKYQVFEGFELRGKTLGIVGFGVIGRRVAEIAQGFGMKVVAYNRTPFGHASVESVALDPLLARSDIVSLHMAVAPDNTDLFNKSKFALMKPESVLISTAGDGLIDIPDLYDALEHKRIAGAALDILADAEVARRLIKLQNVIATPHIGFYTQEAIRNLADITVANVVKFAAGSPENIVNEARP